MDLKGRTRFAPSIVASTLPLAYTNSCEGKKLLMRISFWLGFVCLAVAVLSAGCGPAVSKSDLGTIVTELPKLKGSEEQPFEMKELGPPKEHQPDEDDMKVIPLRRN
jgi:hypothetical protein